MRLRQVALVAAELPPVKAALFELLGLDDAFVDEGVSQFGLQNIVMTIGTTFLEVVSPIQAAAQSGWPVPKAAGTARAKRSAIKTFLARPRMKKWRPRVNFMLFNGLRIDQVRPLLELRA